MLLSHFLFEIISQNSHGQRNRLYLKNYQQNWPYPYPSTNFVIPTNFDITIQTQRNSASDASVGANDVASSVLDQSNNKHVNRDGKDNDDSHSYETPEKNNCRYSSSGDTITTATTPRSPTLPTPGK